MRAGPRGISIDLSAFKLERGPRGGAIDAGPVGAAKGAWDDLVLVPACVVSAVSGRRFDRPAILNSSS